MVLLIICVCSPFIHFAMNLLGFAKTATARAGRNNGRISSNHGADIDGQAIRSYANAGERIYSGHWTISASIFGRET